MCRPRPCQMGAVRWHLADKCDPTCGNGADYRRKKSGTAQVPFNLSDRCGEGHAKSGDQL